MSLRFALVLLLAGSCADEPAARVSDADADAASRLRAAPILPEIAAIIDLEPPGGTVDDYDVRPPGSVVLGIDGAGGVYRILPGGRVLLIDSEGSFGVVGADFDQFVAIATGLPGWRDALRFVGDADVERARRQWQAFVDRHGLEEEAADPWPYGDGYSVATPAQARENIRRHFGVEAASDPFALLHRAVNGSGDASVRWRGDPLVRFGG